MSEHSVIIRFKYESTNLKALHDLEDQLSEAIEEAGEGECDGHDITPDMRDATIYLYGPDAELLYVAAKQVLQQSDCVKRAVATLRFGPAEDGVPERVETLE
ncbi:hypothetical protein [Novipirellula aureliae]|nr:hypothetical protein [Novipirellula aureliae]